MRENEKLKLHFVNVNHGDATIVEFPDYGDLHTAHFAVVDFGAKFKEDRERVTEYMRELVKLRKDNDDTFRCAIEFVCVTHPHNDHYGGLGRFMDAFSQAGSSSHDNVRTFWDCGFRTNATLYNKVLTQKVDPNDNLAFVRVSAGFECEYGDTRVTVLAPSVDLRNRFDTYGVGKNDASVVLKIKYGDSYAVLAADAEFASWGKSTEEFPRRERIKFFRDALGLSKRGETSDQLKCNLLKVSHHGSKHGTSLEYLERLKPRHVVISAGSPSWYEKRVPSWAGDFPHDLTTRILKHLPDKATRYVTGTHGNLIFKYGGGWEPSDVKKFKTKPGSTKFPKALRENWQEEP
jgi:competence protein ComEC